MRQDRVREFFNRRLVKPLRDQLVQGTSPEKLALTCSVAAILAVFPVLGSTTVLCVIAGLALRLNQPVLQAINYVMYPVQLALIPVFLLMGARLTGSETLFLDPHSIVNLFAHDPKLFFSRYGMAGLHAVFVWTLLAPPTGWLIYKLSRKLIFELKAGTP